MAIIDVALPGESGWELGEKIKDKHFNIQVISMTGYNGEYIGKYGVGDEKFYHITQKPFTMYELLRHIRLAFSCEKS